MPNITTYILFSFAYECVHSYLYEMLYTIFCLYFIHIDIGYESQCIVFSSIVEIMCFCACMGACFEHASMILK